MVSVLVGWAGGDWAEGGQDEGEGGLGGVEAVGAAAAPSSCRPGREPRDETPKSRVNPAPGRANGTLSTRTPGSGQSRRRRRARISSRHTEIEMPADRVNPVGIPPSSGRVAAQRAHQPPAPQRNIDNDPPRFEPDRPDPHALKTQKRGKCRGDAHVVLPCKPLTFEQPAACPARTAPRRY
jgi:hypothetical protein